jgi:hypothetical protein
MAITLTSSNRTDTVVGGLTAPNNLALPVNNYVADWSVLSSEPKRKVYVNRTSPLMTYEDRLIISQTPIADIYKGLSVPAIYRNEITKGISVLVQFNTWQTKTDSAVVGYMKLLPASCHVVIKVALDPNLTQAHILALVKGAGAGLFGQAEAATVANTIFGWIKVGTTQY